MSEDKKEIKVAKAEAPSQEPHPEKRHKKKISLTQEEYQALKDKEKLADEYLDKLLRLQAEFENFKKRMDKEKSDFIKYASEELIIELLSIIDSFERAFDSISKSKDFKVLHQGVEMILKQIHQLLEKRGLKKIESLGKTFDPLKHEAVMHIPSDEHPENTVVEEIQTGYTLGDRVLRPALVKVAKEKSKETETKK